MKGKTLFIIYQAGRIITAIILSICVIFLLLKTQMLQAINTLGGKCCNLFMACARSVLYSNLKCLC